jgi:uncharacterized protein (DUF697 family)
MVVCGGFRLVRVVAQLAESVGKVPGGATDGGAARRHGWRLGRETRHFHIRMKLVGQMRTTKNRNK